MSFFSSWMLADYAIVVLAAWCTASIKLNEVNEKQVVYRRLNKSVLCLVGFSMVLGWWFRLDEIWMVLVLLALLLLVFFCLADHVFLAFLAAYVINVLANASLLIREVSAPALILFKFCVYAVATVLLIKVLRHRTHCPRTDVRGQ